MSRKGMEKGWKRDETNQTQFCWAFRKTRSRERNRSCQSILRSWMERNLRRIIRIIWINTIDIFLWMQCLFLFFSACVRIRMTRSSCWRGRRKQDMQKKGSINKHGRGKTRRNQSEQNARQRAREWLACKNLQEAFLKPKLACYYLPAIISPL